MGLPQGLPEWESSWRQGIKQLEKKAFKKRKPAFSNTGQIRGAAGIRERLRNSGKKGGQYIFIKKRWRLKPSTLLANESLLK